MLVAVKNMKSFDLDAKSPMSLHIKPCLLVDHVGTQRLFIDLLANSMLLSNKCICGVICEKHFASSYVDFNFHSSFLFFYFLLVWLLLALLQQITREDCFRFPNERVFKGILKFPPFLVADKSIFNSFTFIQNQSNLPLTRILLLLDGVYF